MINVRTARMLADYRTWANRRLFDNLAQLPAGEVEKQRAGVFGTIIGTLNHIYVVDRIWQAHLEGRGHNFKTSHDLIHPVLSDLREAQKAVDRWYVDWADRQTDASLDKPLRFTFVSGESGTMSAGAMFLHVVNHASYHRGWIVQIYFEIPAMPPMTDLPVYMRETDPHFNSLNAPTVEPTCAPQFASATNVLPDRYR
ncbi:damage-inducible protein DinB [Pseudomonas sp. C1C7]|uniref:DinB family protein n=1 Tax=Pseudomonas sp. C1C7 TaxID=2735272 RepID=UPI001586ACA6|nr:DinB family protein [Pseudomonas sp. C1C7]NUT77695.1 damage-inducible protein DinB [Pseudomonas sp. C1C7]